MKAGMEPIREDIDSIQIDQTRGKWPYIAAFLVEKKPGGKQSLAVAIDDNEGGQVIGEGVGRAAVILSRKKAEALRDFLVRVL